MKFLAKIKKIPFYFRLRSYGIVLLVSLSLYFANQFSIKEEIDSSVSLNIINSNQIDFYINNILESNQYATEKEFMYFNNPGEFSGTVWVDENVNGLYDNNETLVDQVLVSLFRCNGELLYTTNTDLNGKYLFNNLPSGTYKLRFGISGLPIEYDFTSQDVGNNDDIDSDVNLFGGTSCLDFDSSIGIDNMDAGLLYKGSIGDLVWDDSNGNGIRDGSELGIGEVEVSLFNQFGFLVSTTETNSIGNYIFNNVSQGLYYLHFNVSENYEKTFPNVGNINLDSDVTGNNGLNTTDVFYVMAGQTLSNIDAGFFECLTICGSTWLDDNENDIMNLTENGVNGMKVHLWKLNNGSWVKWKSTLTSQKPNTPSDDGYFEFCTAPGTYYIEIINSPCGLLQVNPFIGGVNEDSDINNANGIGTTNSFTIINGQSKCDLGAGYYTSTSIEGLVWLDENKDGVRDTIESRIEDVLVEVFNLNDEKFAQTFTDSLGHYEIDYFKKQDYYLKFTPFLDVSATIPDNTNENFDSDVNHENGLNTTKNIIYGLCNEVEIIDAGYVVIILPVEWISIKVEEKEKAHLLSWVVASERNIEYYQIERSIDGINNFSVIREIDYKANNAKTNEYNYLDNDLKHDGIYYYRIKQVDFDGKYSYSDVIKILRNNQNKVSIYPNPCVSSFSLQTKISLDGKIVIEIFNSNGSLIKTINQDANNLVVNVTDLEPGYYSLKLVLNEVVYHEKLIIID